MARKPRIHYQHAVYHVIARGNNRENIFFEGNDKEKYLELLSRYRQKFAFELFSYVLMDNHVHLLIRVNQAPLAKIMQGIQLTYTQYFNRKYSHVGHVFQQRYKAKICSGDAYLIALVCYIHQNPCRAGLREGLFYPWSSHQEYMRGYGQKVDPRFVLGMISKDLKHAITVYTEKVSDLQAEFLEDSALNVNCDFPIINTSINEEKESDMIDYHVVRMTFEELARQIAEEMNVPLEELLGRCRIRRVVEARNLLIFQAVKACICTKTDLAVKLQVDPARITRGYQQVENKKSIKEISQT